MSTAKKLPVLLTLFGALIALAAPVAALTPSGANSTHGGALSASTLAPVYIHFKPRSAIGVQGGSVTISGVVWDSGSHSYTASSFTL